MIEQSRVVYPRPPLLHIWQQGSIEWAEKRGLSQADVNEIEDELVSFCAKRDYFQLLRRIEALPQLKQQEQGLKRDLEALYKKHDRALKRDKHLIESAMLPLQWDYQFVVGQIAVIESEQEALTARVPEKWKAFYGNVIVDDCVGDYKKAVGE